MSGHMLMGTLCSGWCGEAMGPVAMDGGRTAADGGAWCGPGGPSAAAAAAAWCSPGSIDWNGCAAPMCGLSPSMAAAACECGGTKECLADAGSALSKSALS